MSPALKTALIFSSLGLFAFSKPNQFPTFNYKSIEGKEINNGFFLRKNTIVVMAHLGCPPTMMMLGDLEEVDSASFLFLLTLENTTAQVQEFNSDDKNLGSEVRKYFKLKPIAIEVIAECYNPNIKYEGKDMIIEGQCKKLSRKIKTRSSPCLLYINRNGEIIKKKEGYS